MFVNLPVKLMSRLILLPLLLALVAFLPFLCESVLLIARVVP